MKNILVYLIFILCLNPLRAQEYSVADFQGVWKIEGKEDYEVWGIVDDEHLVGHGYKVRNQEKQVTEYLSIESRTGSIVYTATVIDQNKAKPILFTCMPSKGRSFQFENPAHDFPTRIRYTFRSFDQLFVEVQGEKGQGFSFIMNKISKQ